MTFARALFSNRGVRGATFDDGKKSERSTGSLRPAE